MSKRVGVRCRQELPDGTFVDAIASWHVDEDAGTISVNDGEPFPIAELAEALGQLGWEMNSAP